LVPHELDVYAGCRQRARVILHSGTASQIPDDNHRGAHFFDEKNRKT
jgi:hypothetical protein